MYFNGSILIIILVLFTSAIVCNNYKAGSCFSLTNKQSNKQINESSPDRFFDQNNSTN